MSGVLNNIEEISLVKFIAKFQYLAICDAKYLFNSKRYYRNRISKLIKQGYIKRIKLSLVLDNLGIQYVKLCNYEYTKRNRNSKYKQRLLDISNLGAYYNNSKTVQIKPSFLIKDKEIFTTTGRRFIGVFEIGGIEYLTYQITQERLQSYINTVIYDIQKEHKYKNIIILVNDINRINIQEFAFGYNQVLIVEDNEENRKKLENLNSINWPDIIYKFYKDEVHISEHSFCDYTDGKNKYISTFYFLDTEKINRLKYFLRENNKSNVEIICSEELRKRLEKEFKNITINTIEFDKYIIKGQYCYD